MIEAAKNKNNNGGAKQGFAKSGNMAATKSSNVNNSGNKTKMVNRGQRGK